MTEERAHTWWRIGCPASRPQSWPETGRELDAGDKLEPRPGPGWHDATIRLTNILPAIGTQLSFCGLCAECSQTMS